MSQIQLNRTVCAAPDGKALFPELSGTFANEIVGIVGRNGCGKSTLLRTIAGELSPASGSVSFDGTAIYIGQANIAGGLDIGEALGIQPQLDTLARFDGGIASEADFELADWELPLRLEKALADFGLPGLAMDRVVESLSGGERNRLKFMAAALQQPDILLLDEPTNDLDGEGRQMVDRLISDWQGPVVVASHDRRLLETMDRIIELTPVSTLDVSGGWSALVAAREEQRTRALSALAHAKAEVKSAQGAQQSKIERQQQRDRQGRISAANRDASKLEMNAQKERAQSTSSRNMAIGNQRSSEALEAAELAEAAVERVTPIQIDLPQCGLFPSHVVLKAEGLHLKRGNRTLFSAIDITITGPERIFLCGRNGSGKSSLARILAGHDVPTSGAMHADKERIAFLDQHLELLDHDETVLEAVQRHAPELDRNAAHAALARFGFRANWSARSTSDMSGGEKVRLALACLFCGDSPPHLLILDEPTNHLDVQSIEMLETALIQYDGAILCSTHDDAFRRRLNLSRSIDLGADL